MEDAKTAILDASLPHVAFDGWSEDTFRAAAADADVPLEQARAIFPRGALDLAIAFHQRGDAQMVARLKAENLLSMRFRDRVAAGVRFRLEAVGEDKEAVRRGSTLFALPQNAAEGAKLIWGTADAIWTTLGDSAQDFNWYTKRATLSGVYAATVLYWLGDESEGHQATWEFLDRRIENVMQFEKVKAQVNANPLASKLMAGPNWVLSQIKAPQAGIDPNLPGRMTPK
ncbi:ubiquinone biosynthesis protein COQ9 [Litoreibacter ponti]|uniref:Ubiquinone biosynthesis protein COQ9 n=1 Tax=Litoreibacter ponti TaxID=1510457 RepID=A0A2T6BFQ8_9RHOB|nr:COQ9 family protein [Litoreibacter ponti]PTX54902.1 ubiquinone biosynthesis protein COQ9 [Litoreibacter ponti]